MKSLKLRAKSSFTLIELSVLILIISVFLAGTFTLLTNREEGRKVTATNEKIQTIYKSLGIFLSKNGYLPCPAAINLPITNINYGIAAETCANPPAGGSGYFKSSFHDFVYYGMIPTTTLGLPSDFSVDGFGSKFSYAIINGFTKAEFFALDIASTNDGLGNFYSTYSKDVALGSGYRFFLNDRKRNSAGTVINTALTNDAMFVLISHGANKSGAWSQNATEPNSLSSSNEELWNSITGNIDSPASGKADFYNSNANISTPFPFVFSSTIDGVFDDILFYKSRNEMVRDFKLFSLLPCSRNITQSVTYGAPSNFSWTGGLNIKYGEIISSTNACPGGFQGGPKYPGKKCGAFGNWENAVARPCILG